ncbi:MAG: hypothetical protein M3256_14935 [Actinomycetota bacterium]|nr:hypothetical protein [Actinomycetota bacterium]
MTLVPSGLGKTHMLHATISTGTAVAETRQSLDPPLGHLRQGTGQPAGETVTMAAHEIRVQNWGEGLVSMSNVEHQLADTKDDIKLALVQAITKGAPRAVSEGQCKALRDLAQAFIFLPVMGDLPDFVHSHGGAAVTPGNATPPSSGPAHAHGSPATGSAQSAHGSHHTPSSADTPPLPPDLEERLDEIMEDPGGVEDEASEGGAPAVPSAPSPITPEQIRLEDELEEARIALLDALAKSAHKPLENSACVVLLAEAFNLLPRPIGMSVSGGGQGQVTPPAPTPSPGHSHGL